VGWNQQLEAIAPSVLPDSLTSLMPLSSDSALIQMLQTLLDVVDFAPQK
jgi:hypothetical protein